MDPTACLERFVRALDEGDLEEANAAHEDLSTWLARGGFEPQWASLVGEQGERRISRREFFAYNPRTGKIGAQS